SLNGRRWIIDPIDGTRDFVRGNPFWAVLIGLEVDGEVVAGVSHMPALKNMYSAVKGAGAFCNEDRLQVSSLQEPSEAVVCLNGFNNLTAHPFSKNLLEWLSGFWAVRSLGGCMDAMMLAAGQVDVWIEPHAKAWDLAALQIILEEAGAVFINLDGGRSIYGGNCAAFVPALEGPVRKLLNLPVAT
ncbi:MAG: inositol monophosphatase family protein, partial [Bryobacteraceae bacterium]